MIRRRIITLAMAIALTVTAIGGATIVADTLELSLTPQAYACEASGGSGGGC